MIPPTPLNKGGFILLSSSVKIITSFSSSLPRGVRGDQITRKSWSQYPGGYAWTAETLRLGTEAKVNSKLVSNCGLTSSDIKYALDALEAVKEEAIIEAVASPPHEWGITMEERMIIIEFFIQRQQSLLESLVCYLINKV